MNRIAILIDKVESLSDSLSLGGRCRVIIICKGVTTISWIWIPVISGIQGIGWICSTIKATNDPRIFTCSRDNVWIRRK